MYTTQGGGSRGNGGREGELGQTFGYKPWSDFGPLGRNRALPSCHSSLYQQRDEEPSSLKRGGGGGRAQQQSERKGVERRKQIKQTRGCFTVHPLREGNCCERQENITQHQKYSKNYPQRKPAIKTRINQFIRKLCYSGVLSSLDRIMK